MDFSCFSIKQCNMFLVMITNIYIKMKNSALYKSLEKSDWSVDLARRMTCVTVRVSPSVQLIVCQIGKC